MTACTNKARGAVVAALAGVLRGAVVAALAGVLALGAVPAVALATGSDVSLQFANEYDGSLTFVGGNEIQATGLNLDIEIDDVKLANTTVAFDADSFDVDYYESNEDGDQLGAVSAVKDPGYYLVVATGKGTYAGQSAAGLINVKPAAFPRFTVYEVNPDDARDLSDTSFMYTGSDLTAGVYAKGLVEGQDYTYKILKGKTDNVDSAESVALHDAGTYVVYVIGQGKYAGEKEVFDINVEEFDFDACDVTVDDVINSDTKPANPTKVVSTKRGYEGTELDPSLVSLEMVSGTNAANKPVQLFNELGEYVFEASVDPTNDNISGSDTKSGITVNKVAGELTYMYGKEELKDEYTVVNTDFEDFDWNNLRVYAGDDQLDRDNGYKLNVYKNGVPKQGNNLKNGVPGTYEVVLEAEPSKLGYKYGGSKTVIVKVVEDVLDADANVFVTLDDKLVTSIEKEYDGKAITFVPGNTGNLKVTVEDADGNPLSYGSANDYTVAIYNEYNENVTGSPIVNAGTYTLVVKSSTYELTGTTEMTITINKADLTQLKVNALEDWSGAEYLPMAGAYVDGKKVTSSKAYDTIDDFKLQYMKDGKWTDLWNNITTNSSLFSVEKWNAEKGEWEKQTSPYCKTAGQYRIVMKGDATFTQNYAFADEDTNSTAVEFLVVDPEQLEFTDVKPGDAFFNCIDWMFDAGYVKGYADSNVYGQNDTIKRADVVTILYRMAKGTPSYELDLGYSETQGWVTGFGDVDGNMYYAKAIGWANKLGIVHGYDDGNFRPEQNVTREELATMLANFAKVAYGEDVKLDEAALETMPDAGSVSTFAEKAVSWCVANGLMGNGGSINPASSITRGETTAMGYNYMTKVVGMSNVNADA